MNNKVVVIYGAGASHASGYEVKIPSEGKNGLVKHLVDKDYFDQEHIKKLVNTIYYAIR